MLGGDRRRSLSAVLSAAVVLVLCPLLTWTGQAASPPVELKNWSFRIVTTFTQTGPNDYFWRDRSTYESQAGSFSMTWTASMNHRIPSECEPGNFIMGTVSSADGSGTGELEGFAGGSPADYGLPPGDYVGVLPAAPRELALTSVIHTCPGETFVYETLEHPHTNTAFIPGTVESLAALPVGTILEDSYQRTSEELGTTTTYEVSYVAVKGVMDNDLDDDGVPNATDNCMTTPNAGQEDADADGVGDLCDNCLVVANAGQADVDSDGLGDACEVIVAVNDSYQAQTLAENQTIPLNVLGNDVGDGLTLTHAYPMTGPMGGLPVGSVSTASGSILWNVPISSGGGPRLGTHFLGYQARDRYGNVDDAVVAVRLYDCATLQTGVFSTEEHARLDWRHATYCFDSEKVWSSGRAHLITTDNAERINIVLGGLGFEQKWTKPINPRPYKSGYGWSLGVANRADSPQLQFCTGLPTAALKAALKALSVKTLQWLSILLTGRVGGDSKAEVIDALFDGMDQANPVARKPCWTTSKVAAHHSVLPNGDFVFVHNYGQSKGGLKHTFKLTYASGGRTPKAVKDGKLIKWRGDDRRKISISWSCLAYSACKPKIKGK